MSICAKWHDLWWFHALRGWRFSRFTEYLLPVAIACLVAPLLHFAFASSGIIVGRD